MAIEKTIKKDVWKNIFRLIVPHKKKFLWVVTLGLLSTGASLVEPLIYREAINDVAGLFVRQARENAQKDLGVDREEEESIRPMMRSERPDSGQALTNPSLTPDSPATIVHRTPHTASPAPHGRGHVAARSPTQALQTLLWAVALLFVINLVGTL